MKIFDRQPKAGVPIRHGMFFTAWLRMARAWETLTVAGGRVSWHNGIPTIIIDADASGGLPGGGAEGEVLTLDADLVAEWAASTGLPSGTVENDILSLDVDLNAEWINPPADELPSGGSQYQVLQRDGVGDAVWDWVRAHA